VTSSELLLHAPFEIVHLKMYCPSLSPVTVDVGLVGSVIVATVPPDNCVHLPVPVVGVFPANVAVVPHTASWSAPALAVVAAAEIVMVTVL
jgi:hypothetical protein